MNHSSESKFEMWFVRPYESLLEARNNNPDEAQDAAYFVLSMGCFLCERYYRIQTRTENSLSKKERDLPENAGYDDRFKHAAATALGIPAGVFIDFWLVLRNGIQHQGVPRIFKIKDEDGTVLRTLIHEISSAFDGIPRKDKQSGYTRIYLDPWKFTRIMLDTFLADTPSLDVGFDHPLAEIYER